MRWLLITRSGLFPVGILALSLLLSPPSVGCVRTHPASAQEQKRRLVDEDRSDDEFAYYPLPRIEIQFICAHDVRPNFSATDILQQYYVDEFLSKVKDYNPNNETFEMNAAISINDVGDIEENKWYYPLCNQSSTNVLVTMDVTGYFGIRGQDWSGNLYQLSATGDVLAKNTTWYVIDHMDRRVGTHSLREYFNKHVCQGDELVSFESNTLRWNDPLSRSDRPPHQQSNSSSPSIKPTTTNPPYPSTNNPMFFEHNLYFLCDGADDMILEDEELPDSSFVILGLFVGMAMVYMISSELKAPVGERMAGEPLGHPDGFLVRRELEMV